MKLLEASSVLISQKDVIVADCATVTSVAISWFGLIDKVASVILVLSVIILNVIIIRKHWMELKMAQKRRKDD